MWVVFLFLIIQLNKPRLSKNKSIYNNGEGVRGSTELKTFWSSRGQRNQHENQCDTLGALKVLCKRKNVKCSLICKLLKHLKS